ncbi:MAG TPA: hypothetical protein PKG54_18700 [Phycisphaerae bacterium]|jgi:hypothetical protein|nr:hypothetical protein [Phycisphaerae bacterium]HOB76544.1 hypothetical protein [Phycisphaerae bacterium]HOJ56561.1 hypothetical protein [Phycisphaerae bacterium]HOL28351.1 hypothetical protein [Phycisphaerae bacterium]HPP19937.1 hypothetical protein [Phycisphaerae bacterium]
MKIPGTIRGGVVVLEEPVPLPEGTRVIVELPEPKPPRKQRKPGSALGILTVIQEDDEHIKDFAEYM